ncbi:phosphoglycerate kinase [Candidatus Curtissbacteria bacterium]|nr:phosphoglycerate kinase [Candidatus Curtissbacteria bacterium]
MKLLSSLDVSGKKVFLRADLDVSIADVNSKQESIRLQNLKPTVDWLLEHGAKQIVIAGHIDRPEKPDPTLSTKNLLGPLENILGQKIVFKGDFESDKYSSSEVEKISIGSSPPFDFALYQTVPGFAQGRTINRVILLENLRFWPGEEANNPDFAKQLATLSDVYINDAFGVSHRAHASMVGVPLLLPHAAGLHLAREIEELSKLLKAPQRPFVAIVGGAKIETKMPVISHLAKVADQVLVGGELPLEIKASGKSFSENVYVGTLTADNKELSEESAKRFLESIRVAKTIVWNGPTGVFEEGFDKVSLAIADAIFASGAHSVVGGGETTQFLAQSGLLPKFSFVSSGGGAMLEFLAGRELPGIKALE